MISIKKSFSTIFKFRWLIATAVFILLVYSGIHGSSITAWYDMISSHGDNVETNLFGQTRKIRGDEWIVSTPLIAAQCNDESFFPRVNENIAGGMNLFVCTPPSPVWDYSVPGQVFNWGYFLFGFKHGLSWNWNLKYILLFMFSLECFLIWTKRNIPLSLLAAFSILLAAPSQWWDTTVPYILSTMFASAFFAYQIFKRDNPLIKIICSAALFISITTFLFSFYPPFQYPLIPVMIVLAFSFIYSVKSKTKTSKIFSSLLILAALILMVLEIMYFSNTYKDVISTISNSSYPGKRIHLGGSFKLISELLLLKFVTLFTSWIVPNFSNECDISTFFIPVIPVLILTGYGFIKHKHNFDIAFKALFVISVILLLWCSFQWPVFIAEKSGLFILGPQRCIVILTFILMLLTFKLFDSRLKAHIVSSWKTAAIITSISVLSTLYGIYYHKNILKFFTKEPVLQNIIFLIIAILLLTIITIGLCRTNKRLFFSGYIIVSILTGFFVHPVFIGDSPLSNRKITTEFREIENTYGKGIWVSRKATTAQFLISQGFSFLNGVHTYARPDIWEQIDPDGKYKEVWNRYSHVEIYVDENKTEESTAHALIPDKYHWCLSVKDIKKLNVKYVITRNRKINHPELKHIKDIDDMGIYLVTEPDN